jgi:hypothetical protein
LPPEARASAVVVEVTPRRSSSERNLSSARIDAFARGILGQAQRSADFGEGALLEKP